MKKNQYRITRPIATCTNKWSVEVRRVDNTVFPNGKIMMRLPADHLNDLARAIRVFKKENRA